MFEVDLYFYIFKIGALSLVAEELKSDIIKVRSLATTVLSGVGISAAMIAISLSIDSVTATNLFNIVVNLIVTTILIGLGRLPSTAPLGIQRSAP